MTLAIYTSTVQPAVVPRITTKLRYEDGIIGQIDATMEPAFSTDGVVLASGDHVRVRCGRFLAPVIQDAPAQLSSGVEI